MSTLRRHSAPLALLVLTCIGVQTLDMGLCCDTSTPVQTTGGKVFVVDATSLLHLAARPSASGEERGATDQMTQPDCLCHLVFTSTSLAPALHRATAPTSLLTEAPEPLCSALLPPPGHVPIA